MFCLISPLLARNIPEISGLALSNLLPGKQKSVMCIQFFSVFVNWVYVRSIYFCT